MPERTNPAASAAVMRLAAAFATRLVIDTPPFNGINHCGPGSRLPARQKGLTPSREGAEIRDGLGNLTVLARLSARERAPVSDQPFGPFAPSRLCVRFSTGCATVKWAQARGRPGPSPC